MSFIRPEARAGLRRWRDVLIGGAIVLLGLWWAVTSFGLLRWLAFVILAAGLGLIWAGIQRARFASGHGGLGLVQVDEGQITYLAPVGGGFAARDALTRVEIAPDRAGLPVWRFWMSGEALVIPLRAEGSEALFDVLTTLAGVDIAAAIKANREHPRHPVVIWQHKGSAHVSQPRRLN